VLPEESDKGKEAVGKWGQESLKVPSRKSGDFQLWGIQNTIGTGDKRKNFKNQGGKV